MLYRSYYWIYTPIALFFYLKMIRMDTAEIIISELKRRIEPHRDVEIEKLSREDLENKYQELRHNIAEVIGVYSK